MSASEGPDEDDIALFRSAVGDVTPVDGNRVDEQPPRPAPRPYQAERDARQVMHDLLSDDYDPADVQPGEMLSFCRPGVRTTVFRRLRRGQYRIGAELDLHGMTVPLARQSLVAFLEHARERDRRCVRIIHGKGRRSTNEGPVLKGMVSHWLRQRDEVLAFASALPVDGGTGAVYVLLRRAA